MRRNLDNQLELWKYFQARADTLKAEMFERVTWVLGLMGAIVAFAVYEVNKYADPQLCFVLWVLAGIGLLLCIYAWIIIHDSAKHIRRNWARAERCMAQVDGLTEIWDGLIPKPPRASWWRRPWNQILLIVWGFMGGFGVAFVWPNVVVNLLLPKP